MKKLTFILLILSCFAAKAQSTYSISGVVSDDKGGPVPGATVFLANTNYITAANNEGKFNLNGLQPGYYRMIIKMVGFIAYTKDLFIKTSFPDLHISLTESVTTLNTINIIAKANVISYADREKYLALFNKYFIGESANAAKCKLLNPGAIDFSYDKDNAVLEASSEKFLIIENQSLGYKLHYLLTEFKLDLNNLLLSYDGSLYFEELKGTKSQQEKWEEERQLTYEGSISHFFKSAFNNTLTSEGFLVYKVPDTNAYEKLKKTDIKHLKPLKNPNSLFTTIDANLKSFNLAALKKDSDELYIIYTKKPESPEYRITVPLQSPHHVRVIASESGRSIIPPFKIPSKQYQVTVIHPLLDSMLFDSSGNIGAAKKSILPRGYWAWARTADFLPPNYKTSVEDQLKDPPKTNLDLIVNATDSARDRVPIEKLYLQTDKPYYTLGDTLWFKSYLLNADYLTPSTRSGLLYIELDNSNNQMIKRIMVPVVSGISWGDIALNEEEVPEGSYTLKAYTNWMRNFGEDYIFKKNIYISALSGSTLVKASFKLDSLAGKNKVTANLLFANLDKDPIRLKDMQLKVMNGKHNLFKDKATTGMDGRLDVNFELADKAQLKNLSIIANQIGKGITDTATLTIPVTINRPENMDVQFMPEGGNLVTGITTKVGFKAIGEDGKGTDVTGKIINSKNQMITNMATLHKGMGSFELTPEANESYSAIIDLPNKTTKSYPLPKVNPTGTAIRITKGNDSLEVTISNTTNNNTYYLIGQSRDVICYAATISFKKQMTNKTIAKNLFPTGIARFTLLDQNNVPLNERIIYIDHHDNLNITINPNKSNYTIRDSIALAVQVKDKDGSPVHGTFGLAVTDNSQIKPDSIGSNVLNNLLFTSDLKGTVEEPGWYFENDNNPTIKQSNNKTIALDNLLLTQGWVGYDWKDVFQAKLAPIQFPAEKEFIIQGKVTNVLNKPVEKSQVVLIGKTPAVFRDTITGKDGIFTFKGLFPIDTAEFKIEARNKSGKEFNVGIEMLNEFKSPVFTSNRSIAPWYVNSDTTLLSNNATKQAQLQAEANYKGEGHLLKELKIEKKKIIPDSHNLNGPGEADQIIDEKEILKAGKMTLADLLQKKIKEFRDLGPWTICPGKCTTFQTSYLINDKLIFFIFDGILLRASAIGHVNRYVYIKSYLDYFSAEDIKGIETTAQYAAKYAIHLNINSGFYSELAYPVAFIEITTRSGHGPWMMVTPGTYLYKPLPYTLPKQFYSPRYTVKNITTAMGTDLRSTVHWEPNVITDKNGKATVSFFSADKPADYTVIIEGADLNGNLGYKRQQIKVVSSAALK
jgi:hypothetical protein